MLSAHKFIKKSDKVDYKIVFVKDIRVFQIWAVKIPDIL